MTPLTPKTRKLIVSAVAAGSPWPVCASSAGVPHAVLRGWMTRGSALAATIIEKGQPPEPLSDLDVQCMKLADEITAAKEGVARKMCATIVRNGKKSWVAALAWLRFSYPEVFNPSASETKEAVGGVRQAAVIYLPDNGRDPQ